MMDLANLTCVSSTRSKSKYQISKIFHIARIPITVKVNSRKHQIFKVMCFTIKGAHMKWNPLLKLGPNRSLILVKPRNKGLHEVVKPLNKGLHEVIKPLNKGLCEVELNIKPQNKSTHEVELNVKAQHKGLREVELNIKTQIRAPHEVELNVKPQNIRAHVRGGAEHKAPKQEPT
jgi:hypothetical protein